MDRNDNQNRSDNNPDKREDFKKRIHDGIGWLKETEDRARNFANQNLADIAAAARGRMQQLRDHPDLDLLHDDKMRERVERRNDGTEYKDRDRSTALASNGTRSDEPQRVTPPPFDPNAGQSNPFRDDKEDPNRQSAPGTEIGGPDRGKEGTYTPGEPRFDVPNKNFNQPHAVDLNKDGTLQQAPNSLGTQPDVRKDQ